MNRPPAVRPAIVWMVGLMGAGKTTVGRRVAARLGWRFVDNDAELEVATGRTAAEIGEREGPATLHRLEWAKVAEVAVRPPPFVAAVPASVADSNGVLDLIAGTGVVVYLRADVETLARRIRHTEHRPWVDTDVPGLLTPMAEQREPAYLRIADLVVESLDSGPEVVADRIVNWLRDHHPVDLKAT